MSVDISETLGPYRLLAKLGQGGMGTVYSAVHATLERSVALKVLSPEFSAHHEYVSRFLREARTLAAIDHPNIIRVYDSGELKGQYYIAMELVDGGNLLAIADARAKIPESDALRLMLQALKGLAAAHSRGLIHRDIKPENLLLGVDGILRIVDFGLAADSATDLHLTQAGTCLGTPMYMSPEQADGETADPRSDLYSLGAAFYRILIGRPPFVSATVMNLLYKQKFEVPPDPQALRADLSRPAADLLLHFLAKRREDRPADAAAAIALVERVLDGQSIPAPPKFVPPAGRLQITESQLGISADGETAVLFGSAPRRLSARHVPPSRRQTALVAGVLLALLAGLALWGFYGEPRHDEARRAEILPEVAPKPHKQLSPADIKERLALGDRQFSANHIPEARAIYLEALKDAPENTQLMARRDRADRRIKFDRDMIQAEEFEKTGHLEDALIRYAEAAALDEDNVAQGRIERVRAELEKSKVPVAQFSPAPVSAVELRGREIERAAKSAEELLLLKDYDKAEAAFAHAAELSADSRRDGFLAKSIQCKKLKMLDQAADLEARGEWTQAELSYAKALELGSDPQTIERLAALRAKIKAADEKTDALFRAAMSEGQAAMEAGDFNTARVKFGLAQGLKHDVSTPAAKLNEIEAREMLGRAATARAAGDLKIARQLYQDALAKAPGLEADIQEKIRGLETAPSRASLAAAKARTLAAEGNYDDAAAALEAAAKLEPESDLLNKARKGLEQVRATQTVSETLSKALTGVLEQLDALPKGDQDEVLKKFRESLEKLKSTAGEDTKKVLQVYIKDDFAGVEETLKAVRADMEATVVDLNLVVDHCGKLAQKFDERVVKVPFMPKIGMGGDHKKAERYRQLSELAKTWVLQLKPTKPLPINAEQSKL